jgi:hypothetical protein
VPYRHHSVLETLSNFELFAKRCLLIKTKKSGLVPFVFNKAQKMMWEAVKGQMDANRPVRLVILKGRQLGCSTFCQGFTFWRTVTHRNTHSLVIAHTADATQGIFQMAQTMYEELPAEFRPMLRRSNRKELLFENPNDKERLRNPGLRSRMEVKTAGNEEAGRGITYHVLHLSEVASWPEPEILADSLFPTVPELPGTVIILESTAKGGGEYWHDMYVKSKNKQSGYQAVFLPWFLDPDYALSPEETAEWMATELDSEEEGLVTVHKLTQRQLAFRRKTIAAHGEDYFRQEYPSNDEEAWLGIGTPVFNREQIRKLYEQSILTPPIFVGDIDKETGDLRPSEHHPREKERLRIWEMPIPKQMYVIGVDTAAGTEGGSQCAIVVLTRGLHQKHIATWHDTINALQLVPYIEGLAWMYNEAMVSIEINYTGIATQEAFSRVYSNSYRWRYLDRRTLQPTEKVGWQTMQSTKPLLLAHATHQFNVGRIETLDSELLNQAYGYSYIDNEREVAISEPGVDDDILMAFMIASYTDFLDGLYDRPHLGAKQVSRFELIAPAFSKANDPIYTDMAGDPFEEKGDW